MEELAEEATTAIIGTKEEVWRNELVLVPIIKCVQLEIYLH
jgi:hypothetical protein